MKTLKTLALLLLLPLLTMNMVEAADYFWIGGGGDWEDITHWATTSGGAVTHSQTPTANDDVFFDANSFTGPNQTVTINNSVAFARTLDFTAATSSPTLSAGNNVKLSVFASIQLIADMTFDFNGELFFASDSSGNIIDLAGHDAGENVTFDGAGDWNVVSNLIVVSTIRFTSGDVTFTNIQADCEFLYSRSDANRNITLDNSILTISGTTVDFSRDGNENNIYTCRLSTDNMTWTTVNGGQVNFPSDYAKLYIEGTGSVDFGTLSTVNGNGTFSIVNIDGLTNIAVSQNLDLTKNSNIETSLTVGNLSLYGSYSYVFEATETVEMETLSSTGSCAAAILLSSSISGIPTNWTANQVITADYLTIRDLHINGITNTANNSIDLGNNVGWTFMEKVAEEFFWIGGTGDWDDGNHWSTTSGGAPSGCVPTAVDDVFFDANSFNAVGQTVNVNIANAVCHSMTWENVTNNPSLIGPETNSLLIHGSLSFDPNMAHLFEGDYFFLANDLNNTITSSGKILNKDVYFDNVNGGWNFGDDFQTIREIFFISGNLNTQGHGLGCFRFDSESKNDRTLSLGSSLVTLTQIEGNNFFFWLDSDNLIFDSGTSTIRFNGAVAECVTRGNQQLTYHNVIFTNIFSTLNSVSQGNLTHIFNKVTFLQDGSLTGNNIIDTLVLKNSSSYQISANTYQEIDVIEWDDICDGLVGLTSSRTGATIKLGTTQVLEGFNISKITFDNNPAITAQQSVDGGFNSGVAFEEVMGRDLYWVGGAGDWNDMSHWSQTSGGAGGECVPTIIDNVFFDDNSFTTNNDLINLLNGNKAFCRNLTYTAVNQMGALRVPILEISGNLDLQEIWNIGTTHFVGGLGPQTIRSSVSSIANLEIRGSADVEMLDDLNLFGGIYLFDDVVFITNDHILELGIISVSNTDDTQPTLDFGTSLIRINGSRNGFFYPFTISGVSSPMNNLSNAFFEFTNAETGIYLSSNAELGTVVFTDPAGNASLNIVNSESSFSALIFRGNGTLEGDVPVVMDELVLSGGKSYTFESGVAYTINNSLEAKGNNCLPISWQSSQNGQNVELTMPTDISSVNVDFVEMNGISVVCCDDYFAGNNSTNIGNSNPGWVFGDPSNNPVNEGFFGPDIIICDDNSVTLMPFESGELNSITWNDGSTNLDFTINNNSTVSALVVFSNNCEIRDTVSVSFETSFSIDLGADTTLCEGSSLLLNPNVAGADYEWQDMSTNSTFNVSGTGTYSVFADLGTCSASDTIVVDYQAAPPRVLPEFSVACEGDSILLDADVGLPVTYLWSDGSSDFTFEVKTSDTYVVTITNTACAITDTAEVVFFANPNLDALMDESICEGESISVGPESQPNYLYEWSSGATDAIDVVTSSGFHTLTVTDDNNCTSSDSLFLTVRPIPEFSIGNDTTMCEGEPIEIGTTSIYNNFMWSNGEIQPTTLVTMGGEYRLTATENNCSFTDTINVVEVAKPIVDFGMDRAICEGDSIILDATNVGASYLWSNGSTNAMVSAKLDGTYVAVVDFDGCANSDTINLTTVTAPKFELGEDQVLCEGDSTKLMIAAAPTWIINWNTGAMDDNITVRQSNLYIAETSLDGCTHSDTVNVLFNQLPDVNLGDNQTICDGDSVILDATNFEATYNWNIGSGNAIVSAKTNGTYIVDVDLNGCVQSDTFLLTVEPTPFFDLGSDQDLCEGDSLDLMIAADASWAINWNTGSIADMINVKTTDNYIAETTLGNCTYEDEVMITFNLNPIVDLGGDQEKCEQTSLTLNVETPNVVVQWEDGSTNPTRVIDSRGTYIVVVETPEGCIGQDRVVITDITCTKFEAYFPTAFTPNADGINDTYVVGIPNNVGINEFTFSIYDRWGTLMFQTNDPLAEWDGTFNSKLLNANVFVAVLDITYSDDFSMSTTETITSDFVLMR